MKLKAQYRNDDYSYCEPKRKIAINIFDKNIAVEVMNLIGERIKDAVALSQFELAKEYIDGYLEIERALDAYDDDEKLTSDAETTEEETEVTPC